MIDFFRLFRRTFEAWRKDNPALLSAGISYFTLFSVAPALIILIASAGRLFGKSEAVQRFVERMAGYFNPDVAAAVHGMLAGAAKTAAPATFLGILLLVWGASHMFSALQTTLNIIWGVHAHAGGFRKVIWGRIRAFLMIGGVGFLMMVFFALDLGLAFVKHRLPMFLPPLVVRVVVLSISYALFLGLFTVVFSMVFKFLPDTVIKWRDVWLGGFVSAVLFALGRYLIALYFSKTMVASLYGAAGSVVALLIWVYFSAQILLFGARFTWVCAQSRN